MPDTVYIEFDDQAALAAIQRAADAIGDMPRVLRNIGEALRTSTLDRFESMTSPDGAPWAALSPRYAKQKAKQYPGKGILRREDRMHDAIVWQVDGDTLLVGTNASERGYPYPVVMQFGNTAGTILPRPWLGISAADAEEIQQITLDYIRGALDGAE